MKVVQVARTFLYVAIAALWSISAPAKPKDCPKPETTAIQQSVELTSKTEAISANPRSQTVCRLPTLANTGKIVALPTVQAQARFFTINSVLAEHLGGRDTRDPIRLAVGNATATMADATVSLPITQALSDEPFGLFPFRALEGPLWIKWRGIEADIAAEAPILALCRSQPDRCLSPAAARFLATIAEAREFNGRVKLAVVNRNINLAIRYVSDMTQWGVPDRWSAPLDTNNKGSFDTGLGDCEDFAIAKYVALREVGVDAKDLRIVMLRNVSTGVGHAMLLARNDGHWLMLDNNHMALLDDATLSRAIPLFSIDQHGVNMLAAPYVRETNAMPKTSGSEGLRADRSRTRGE
jgi:predicted transglutaminase-like cysteine proteinase